MTTEKPKKSKSTAGHKATPKDFLKHLRSSDLRGIAKLATETTAGVNQITEGVHQAVLSTLGMPRGKELGKTRGLTGLIYKSINGVTSTFAKSIDSALLALQPVFALVEEEKPGTPERELVLGILNGVMGDRLVETKNPLATPMSFRYRGEALDLAKGKAPSKITGKIVVLIHGLCMNDLQWQVEQHDQNQQPTGVVDIGESLATEFGDTPLYLRYNTGLHTSQNGHMLSGQLEQLLAQWPVPVEELTVIGYSMGGLLTRSACHYAQADAKTWLGKLKHIVFLATPHHGSPLERAGNLLDVLMGVTPYSAPFGKLFKLRSAGITDLRYGHVIDEDWKGHDRFRRKPDCRQHVPLPEGVSCFTIAATIAAKRSKLADRLTGDGLVPLHSALGQHDDPSHTLKFGKTRQAIFHQMNHLEVPGRPEVRQQVLDWLRPTILCA